MTDEQIAALKDKLARPHRIQSDRVLYAACQEALAYIEALEAKADAPRRGRPPKVIDPEPAGHEARP